MSRIHTSARQDTTRTQQKARIYHKPHEPVVIVRDHGVTWTSLERHLAVANPSSPAASPVSLEQKHNSRNQQSDPEATPGYRVSNGLMQHGLDYSLTEASPAQLQDSTAPSSRHPTATPKRNVSKSSNRGIHAARTHVATSHRPPSGSARASSHHRRPTSSTNHHRQTASDIVTYSKSVSPAQTARRHHRKTAKSSIIGLDRHAKSRDTDADKDTEDFPHRQHPQLASSSTSKHASHTRSSASTHRARGSGSARSSSKHSVKPLRNRTIGSPDAVAQGTPSQSVRSGSTQQHPTVTAHSSVDQRHSAAKRAFDTSGPSSNGARVGLAQAVPAELALEYELAKATSAQWCLLLAETQAGFQQQRVHAWQQIETLKEHVGRLTTEVSELQAQVVEQRHKLQAEAMLKAARHLTVVKDQPEAGSLLKQSIKAALNKLDRLRLVNIAHVDTDELRRGMQQLEQRLVRLCHQPDFKRAQAQLDLSAQLRSDEQYCARLREQVHNELVALEADTLRQASMLLHELQMKSAMI
eukprot:TRINITY_DN11555_c1_g1_i3.p1 TRINITY_DN11555_c1_g1~~TRINITY_DN11555_c1_g1_i3.p1  ORF type:complete len:526 (+),score=80.14 TRINITY_DN11555_c1_g1_i3:68-1645(+)